MWGIFGNAFKKSAQGLYKAGKTSAIETTRASAGTLLVFSGIFAYNKIASFYPAVMRANSQESSLNDLSTSSKRF